MRQTKIVGTLGPASNNPQTYRSLVAAGLDVTRLNFSHGNHEEHLNNIRLIRQVASELDVPMAILLDTKGPEVRIKTMAEGTVLKAGDRFILSSGDFIGDHTRAAVTYEELYKDVHPESILLISDGTIVLKVLEVIGEEIHTEVLHGAELTTRKGVNAPGLRINLPAVTEQDKKDITFGVEQGVDFISPSFIRKASDVLEVRKILEDLGAGHIQIISKIENREGLDNIDEILQVSDGIMVARGDLGMEMPMEEVPMAQKLMIAKCNRAGKTVITATQMLESMTHNPRPTRAEAADVANAIIDGTDAVMLSGEMAAGAYPVESVAMMASIALATESSLDYGKLLTQQQDLPYLDSITYAVSRASVVSAYNLNAKAILTATSSGQTARKIAMHHPKTPIVAGVTSEGVRRQLSLVRGVQAHLIEESHDIDTMFHHLEVMAKQAGLVQDNDLVVITCGVPIGVSGTTNMMKIHSIGEVTLKGVGFGEQSFTGIIRFVDDHPERFEPGDILYTRGLDETMAEMVKQAGAIITQEGGYTSMGAIAGTTFQIPTIVGVEHLNDLLEDGMVATVDPRVGIVYKGRYDK
ncbi:MAG TPA: pyruvate kinase [Tissierellia bacterium]|nr:pyruvate kinase [Tissierellia bacterium]